MLTHSVTVQKEMPEYLLLEMANRSIRIIFTKSIRPESRKIQLFIIRIDTERLMISASQVLVRIISSPITCMIITLVPHMTLLNEAEIPKPKKK